MSERWRPRITRTSLFVSLGWQVAVAAALVVTLQSLRTHDFDGLNNMFQIPLALPWFTIPIGGIWSHEVDAWIVATMGWFNGLLLLLYVSKFLASLRRLP